MGVKILCVGLGVGSDLKWWYTTTLSCGGKSEIEPPPEGGCTHGRKEQQELRVVQ